MVENIPPKEYNITIWYKVLIWLIQRQSMKFLTTSEMAQKWDVSRGRITSLCSQGRIAGAILKGNIWLILESTEKLEIQDGSVKMDMRSSRLIQGNLWRKVREVLAYGNSYEYKIGMAQRWLEWSYL